MPQVKAFAAQQARASLGPHRIERRQPGEYDVEIDIAFCGVCHSDLHQVRDEWGGAKFPMVPGHEIVGRVSRVGRGVTRFAAGQHVGVGCFVDACRACDMCKRGHEQYCTDHCAFTYNSLERDRKTPTHGGYSEKIVVNENFVLSIPEGIPLDRAAPLLCAGITTYAPLRRWSVGRGHKVAVVGLGGLGHMGVKLAAAMGAEVTVLSTSRAKEQDARTLGAHQFVLTQGVDAGKLANRFDFILDTVSAAHDVQASLGYLRPEGVLVMVGIIPAALPLETRSLVVGSRVLAGSMIGGISQTQEMLDFCGKHKVAADIEVIKINDINTAYERMLKGDVRYRFVIDNKSL